MTERSLTLIALIVRATKNSATQLVWVVVVVSKENFNMVKELNSLSVPIMLIGSCCKSETWIIHMISSISPVLT